MSSTQVNFHRVAEVSVMNYTANGTSWVELTFTDEDGQTLKVIAFPKDKDTQPILSGLAKGDDKALTAAYAEGRKDEREAIAAEAA